MNFKYAAVTFLLCFLLFLTGCESKDIDRRAFVIAMGIDAGEKNPEHYLISLKIAVPSSDPKKGDSNFIILEEEARSISEAIGKMKSEINKKIDFRAVKMILVGQIITRRNMHAYTDFFVRHPEIQLIAWTAVAKPSAKEALKKKPKTEKGSREFFISAFTDTAAESYSLVPETLSDYYRRVAAHGQDPYMPVIDAEEADLKITRTALFDKKHEVLELNEQQSMTYKMLTKGIQAAPITVESDGTLYTTNLDIKGGTFSIHADSNPPFIEYKVKASGVLQEMNNEETISREDLLRIEQLQENMISDRILALLGKIQKSNIDPFGFGLWYTATHLDNKTKWQNWLNMYPEVQFKASVKITLYSTGEVR